MRLADLRKDAAFALGLARKKPFQVLLQVTNRCNMTCDFCDFWPNGVAPKLELSLADFQRLASQLDELGTMFISVEGGEPLVRKDIIDILRALSKHVTCLYTNGWFVTSKLARSIWEAGVTQVGVSIDYPDAVDHDRRRGIQGATERAWRAIELLRASSPSGGRGVHVMTVLMADTFPHLERLLEQSRDAGVGHWITLVSNTGYRRGKGVACAGTAPMSERLLELRERFPHFRVFKDYVSRIDAFTTGDTTALPRCRAGDQTFNIDHQGGVSPCIENIDWCAGNIRDEPLSQILGRMQGDDRVAGCQKCWTVCRGFAQELGNRGTVSGWVDLVTRMRSR